MSERTVNEHEMSEAATAPDAAKTRPLLAAPELPQMLDLRGSEGVGGTCSDGSCSV